MSRLLAMFCLCLHLAPTPVQAAETVMIADKSALVAALSEAGVGKILELSPGEYGALTLKGGGGTEGSPLILRAADPKHPPVFLSLNLQKTGHLVLDGLVLDYRFADGDPSHVKPFELVDCTAITLRNLLFDGDAAGSGGLGNGYGLGITGSTGITLAQSEIHNFHRGIVAHNSRKVTIQGNDIHSLRSDGMNFAQVKDVVIEENHIHDFQTSPDAEDHADMIQFWTAGTTSPSQNILIRNNVLNSGGGGWTQSIFMRNEMVDQGKAGSAMLYRNVRIEGNVIINAHLHGITVGETKGLIIANNTLVQNVASKGSDKSVGLWIPRIFASAASIDVRILRNVTAEISGYETQASWTIRDNLIVQNQTRAKGGFYDLMFSNAINGDPSDLASFAYRPDGPLFGAGLGAERLNSAEPVIHTGRLIRP